MDRPVYATVPLGVQSQSMGSNTPLQQPSFLANNSVGVNNESNLEFTSNITASPPYSNDHLPSQFQPALGVGQLSLNRSAAEYRRSSVLSHAFHPQGTGYYIRVHTQAFPLPDNVHGIGFERSQFSNSIPTRDLSSFLNLNQFISNSTNVHSNMFGGHPGAHPYEFSRELWYQTSSFSHPAVPINLTAAEFRSNGDVARAPVSSIPGANNPNFLWDQPGTGLQANVAESSFQLSNPLLQHQPADDMNNMYYGPSQSRVIRSRRHLNRRNYVPYSCPRCQHEFAHSQSLVAHMREHSRLEDRTNMVTSSTSRMMNSDAHMLPSTRSPFPPMSLNNLNRGDGNINSSDGTSNRRMNPLMVPETSVGRNHPTDLAQMRSSSAMGTAANDNRGKQVMTSEQASQENKAPNQAQPAAGVAGKDEIPLIFRSVKEESTD